MGDLDDILRRLEPSLGPVGGDPAPLEGGITNRNFRVRLGEHEYVVRLHGKDTDLLGISREAELLANRAAAELGIAPAVAVTFEGVLVTSFVPCEALAPREVAGHVPEIATALRAFHQSHVRLPVTFDVPTLLAEYAASIRRRGTQPPGDYEQIVAIAGRIASALAPVEPSPCHNDLLSGNLLRTDDRVMIVDWEYAGMGDPCFDLGNLAVNNELDDEAQSRLLEAYHGAPPTAAQLARLRLMRLLSDAREAAWGVMQGEVSELDFDFRSYAAEHFARLRASTRGTELDRLLAGARG